VTPLPKNQQRKEVIYVATKKETTKDERIKKEVRRLNRIYKDIDKDNKAIIEGLIRRAAYMLVTLEDWEKDIMENGYYEMFTQSEKTDPYERERPVARLYNTVNKNYQSIIKQLTDLIPKKENSNEEDDGFDAFVMMK
jgi:ABC-type Fe3+-citrate transport system substrate-binding protein